MLKQRSCKRSEKIRMSAFKRPGNVVKFCSMPDLRQQERCTESRVRLRNRRLTRRALRSRKAVNPHLLQPGKQKLLSKKLVWDRPLRLRRLGESKKRGSGKHSRPAV